MKLGRGDYYHYISGWLIINIYIYINFLMYPNFKETFILATDDSYNGFGATLSQLDRNGKEHLIVYASKSLRKEKMNYAATELECAADIWAIEHFHKYLDATKFILVTDHSALKLLCTAEPKGRIVRWILKLQLYNFGIVHRPGRIHSNIDALSRLLMQTTISNRPNES